MSDYDDEEIAYTFTEAQMRKIAGELSERFGWSVQEWIDYLTGVRPRR